MWYHSIVKDGVVRQVVCQMYERRNDKICWNRHFRYGLTQKRNCSIVVFGNDAEIKAGNS